MGKKVALILSVGIICFLFFNFSYPKFFEVVKSEVIFLTLRDKPPKELTINQSVIMFKEYIERKDIPNALSVARNFEGNIEQLNKDERFYIANYLGIIIRAENGLQYEQQLYDDLFKKDYPALLHFFTAISLEA